MRIENLKAIVIKARAFMENDMIVTLLCDDGKKVEAIVKGARSGKSKRKAHIELLNLISATVYQSDRNKYLQSAQAIACFHKAKNRFFDIFALYRILDIINRGVLPEDSQPKIFDLLLETLESLNGGNPHVFTTEVTLIKLADLLGFLPSFRHCGKCHESVSDNLYINPENSSVHCQNCLTQNEIPMELKYRKAIEFFRSASFDMLQKISISEEECSAIEEMLERIFGEHMKLLEVKLA